GFRKRVNVRWRHRQQRPQRATDIAEAGKELRVFFAVSLRMCSEFIGSSFRVFINADRRTIQIEYRHSNGRLGEFKSVPMKLKVVNNLRQQRAGGAGERRAKARMKFFSGAGAADNLATL